MTSSTVHIPIMVEDVMTGLAVRSGGIYVDGTLGGGGHTEVLLNRSAPDGRVLGLDQDLEALKRTTARLSGFGDRLVTRHGNFSEIEALAADAGFSAVDGILLDLGVSSDQLDTPERGFSFRHDAPLDMRMDTSSGVPVSDWLAAATEGQLIQVLRDYGEERQAKRIARGILRARDDSRLEGTLSLAEVVERAVGGRKGARIHPATRTFQALRMAVNEELDVLPRVLEGGLRLLRPGGRMAVISFHSLEDRVVKHIFRTHEGREVSLYQGGSRWEGEEPRVRRVNRKPLEASEDEREQNPRSRSAKLRVIEKLEAA